MFTKLLRQAVKAPLTIVSRRAFAMQTKNDTQYTVKMTETPVSHSPLHDSKTEAEIKSKLHSEEQRHSATESGHEKIYDNSTHFGFEDVNPKDKQSKVNTVFHNVAHNYDIMNDAMSLGIHRIWKDQFVDEVGYLTSRKEVQGDKLVEKPTVILDVAGGTGDIAFRIWEKHNRKARRFGQNDIQIKVLDINSSMLQVGADRARNLGYDSIEFIEGNAESLSLPDNSVDLYTIAFGIRNVPKIELALSEAYRVLKKGGRFMCMEFSKVENPLFSQIYQFYNFNIVPAMGELIARDRASYQYLAESIERFPDQETFAAMIEDAGFEYVTYKNYTNGIVAVHSGFKI